MSLLSPHLILVAVRQCANCTEKINLCHGHMDSILLFLLLSLVVVLMIMISIALRIQVDYRTYSLSEYLNSLKARKEQMMDLLSQV